MVHDHKDTYAPELYDLTDISPMKIAAGKSAIPAVEEGENQIEETGAGSDVSVPIDAQTPTKLAC